MPGSEVHSGKGLKLAKIKEKLGYEPLAPERLGHFLSNSGTSGTVWRNAEKKQKQNPQRRSQAGGK